jgi:hypothetical protein
LFTYQSRLVLQSLEVVIVERLRGELDEQLGRAAGSWVQTILGAGACRKRGSMLHDRSAWPRND